MGNVISVEFLADITDFLDGVQSAVESVSSVAESASGIAELSGAFTEAATAAGELGSEVASVAEQASTLGTSTEEATSTMDATLSDVVSAISNLSGQFADLASSIQASMAQASASVEEVGATAEETGNQVGEAGSKGGGDFMSGMSKVGASLFAVQAGVNMVQGAFQQATGPFGDFQSQMTQLETGAGELPQNLGAISSGIEQMSEQTGESTSQLAQGMFLVSSASVKGASTASAQLAILKDAAEGAAVGGTDLGTMADALTTDLNAYGQGANMAGADTNQMIATVAAGKMHMGQLAASLSAVLPVAASAGISFAQVGGAIATMTAQGEPAQQATQNLANTISALQNPNAQAVQEMQAMGLSANQVSMQLGKKGLTGTLEEISQAVLAHMGPAGLVLQSAFKSSAAAAKDAQIEIQAMPKSLQGVAEAYLKGQVSSKQWSAAMKDLDPITQHMMAQFKSTADRTEQFNQLLTKGNPAAQTYNAAMSKILGGTTGLNTALKLTGDHLSTFQSNVNSIASAATKGGNSITGWSLVQNDFNTKMAQAAAGANVMWINIGQNLAPAILGLMSAMSAVGGVMSGFVGWLNQDSAGAIIVKGALAGLGLGILLFATTFIPMLVTSFIEWAAAAWAAVAPTLIAAAPFIAIGLAIGLLAAGIFLLIQHWGAVVAFMRGVWQGFSSWFMGALHAVGAFFSQIWGDIVSYLQGVWQRIVSGAQTAWNMLVTIVKIALIVLLAIVFAPIVAIAALFIWLYQHNTYFQKLVDAIKNWILNGVNWLRQTWTDILNWIVAKWTWIQDMANIYFSALYFVIQSKITQVRTFLMNVWNDVVTFLVGIWNKIVSNVQDMWTKIESFFSSAWSTYVSTPLTNLWNSITNFISGWPAKAVQWGVNLIQGFINGILSKLGDVGGAVGQIMGKVGNFMGFHSPSKEGPGTELDIWPRNFVQEYAAGLEAGIPLVQAAITHLIEPATALGSFSGGSPTSAATSGASGGGTVVHEHHISVSLDGDDITNSVMARVVSKVRSNGPVGRSAA